MKDRFRLRRARINLTGDFAENFDFKVEGDFGAERWPSILTAPAFQAQTSSSTGINVPEAQIKDRAMEAPFGLEQLTPDPSLYHNRDAVCLPGAITPERQIGAQRLGKAVHERLA